MEFDPDEHLNLDAVQRAQRDRLREKVTRYFSNRAVVHPAVTKVGSLYTMIGPSYDGERITYILTTKRKAAIHQLEAISEIQLSARLYKIAHHFPGGPFAIVCGLYDDDTLLWLDDHIRHDDFNSFWKRERINWQSAEDAAAFMMQTKFHFMHMQSSMVIPSIVQDIPQERMRQYYKEDDRFAAEGQKYEQLLADVTPKIYRPSLVMHNDALELRFCVWIRAGGQVFSMVCRYKPDEGWSTQGEELGREIGEIFLPR